MAQQVKDPVLSLQQLRSLLWYRSNPCFRTFACQGCGQGKKKKKKLKIREREIGRGKDVSVSMPALPITPKLKV